VGLQHVRTNVADVSLNKRCAVVGLVRKLALRINIKSRDDLNTAFAESMSEAADSAE
jgi:hypothetical protein